MLYSLLFVRQRHNVLSVIVRVTGALNLWGGGSAKPPGKFFPAKTWKLIKKSRNIENHMINLYEKTEKVTLVNPFRPPHKKLLYAALFSHTMTLKAYFSTMGLISFDVDII